MFGSLGLILAYERLLLGMRDKGLKEIPDEASPYALTLSRDLIVNTSNGCDVKE
jgi:hypothetical protein